MNAYLTIKTLHIISATILVGTGFGSAFYLFWVNRSGNIAAQSVVARRVIKADWWLTTPAGIFQPLSGLWLMSQSAWTFSHTWIWLTLALYVFAGLCWLPVLFLQIRMAELAEQALERQTPLPARYRRYQRYWEWLGYPAFSAMVIIYFLMVFKPL